MPILRIHFEESESNYEIACRVAGGLSPGDYLEVRGSVYVVSRGRNVNVTVRPTSKQIYQVLQCETVPVNSSVGQSPRRGQVWVPRDKRRQHQVITLTDVFEDFVLTDKGRSISRSRLKRYKLLETLDSEALKRRETLQKMTRPSERSLKISG